ncbi:DUF3592 domain-containing protein [Myroides pelagicus]|uniref:DUF3592 domain-containing protein n=1 Tax=Myroides pelagicus TaxID=270914 RepID=A0A7K1GLN4_9FLAO|nr:DUF3592 domain-containing protein [Myroides pelagicus]MEC4114303.1 DUF3592 domain-containing protein [Myroides pelagicus]MTH29353.1 hypothetical protein [Myroides pelagicus]
MYKILNKLYYPIALLAIGISLLAVANELMYLMFLPVVFIFLAIWRNIIWTERLIRNGIVVKGKVIKHQIASRFDTTVASSRRSHARKDYVVMEFVTNEGETIQGIPREYNLKKSKDKALADDPTSTSQKRGLEDIGTEYKVVYYKTKPSVFTFRNSLNKEDFMFTLNILRFLSVAVAGVLIYILYQYNVVDTFQHLF